MNSSLLEVEDLSVTYLGSEETCAVDQVSFTLDHGEVLSLVGESGSGKTTLGLALLNAFAPRNEVKTTGQVRFEEEDLLAISDNQLNKIRGKKIGMIFQEPLLALNPVFRVGPQIAETIQYHYNLKKRAARFRAQALLSQMELFPAKKIYRYYPHQLSGGMRQRVMIALAFACNPQLVIADEPTSALNESLRSTLMTFLVEHCQRHRTALLLITHDIEIALQYSKRMMVMHRGKIVEKGLTTSIVMRPQHPYTQRLLALSSRSMLAETEQPVDFITHDNERADKRVLQAVW
jgi:ABC-type glutathione transport system ATPase component